MMRKNRAGTDKGTLFPVVIANKRLQSVVHQLLEKRFLRHGITLPQWDVLSSARRNPGASGAAIARDCLVAAQTVNVVLPKLEKMGLIERRRAPTGRVVETWVTPEGLRTSQACDEHVKSLEKGISEAIGAENADQLTALLERCAVFLSGSSSPKLTHL